MQRSVVEENATAPANVRDIGACLVRASDQAHSVASCNKTLGGVGGDRLLAHGGTRNCGNARIHEVVGRAPGAAWCVGAPRLSAMSVEGDSLEGCNALAADGGTIVDTYGRPVEQSASCSVTDPVGNDIEPPGLPGSRINPYSIP